MEGVIGFVGQVLQVRFFRLVPRPVSRRTEIPLILMTTVFCPSGRSWPDQSGKEVIDLTIEDDDDDDVIKVSGLRNA
jgi:hypothetical protein